MAARVKFVEAMAEIVRPAAGHFSVCIMPAMPDPDRQHRVTQFVRWCGQHITGDEKGQAQIYLDRLFQAFGQPGSLEVGGAPEFRIKKATEDGAAPGSGNTAFADYVWKPIVLIEMKKRGADLSRHYSTSSARSSAAALAQETSQSSRQSKGVLQLTLPHCHHAPSFATQLGNYTLVAQHVGHQFLPPELHTGLRGAHSRGASMLVPKATVYKNHFPPARKNQIRSAGQITTVKPEPVSERVDGGTDD